MPIDISAGTDAVATLADVVDWCRSSAFNPLCRDSLAEAAPILAALANNRTFLADMAVAALKDSCREQTRANGYSPQVMLLSPPDGRFFIRANIWPSERDAMLRDTGPEAYFYHQPHDHAFDFLTVGYAGPGYWSDYYDYDGAVDGAVDGLVGETVPLRFVERSRLAPGRILLYRANRDIHDQLPPDSLSVSINIMPLSAAQSWRRQYFFNLGAGTIASCATITGGELLLPLCVRFGSGNGRDLAEDFAARHPDPRMRVAAWKALLSHGAVIADRLAHIERGLSDPCPHIRDHARRLAGSTRSGGSPAGEDAVAMALS